MSLKQEIFRAFFIAFGFTEIFTNTRYLIKNNIEEARKQHKEIPANVTLIQMKRKVICMLSFGIAFALVGMFAYFSHSYPKLLIQLTFILFSIYAISEAVYYHYYRTILFSVLCMALTFSCFI